MQYSLTNYYSDIENIGLKNTWNKILSYLKTANDNFGIFNIDTLSDLYEAGLAFENKDVKKEFGKYYTPEDVSTLMSEWFKNLEGENVCDVCCGTGNLIIAYFKVIGKTETINLIKSKKIFLYDIDETALIICGKRISLLYGEDVIDNINFISNDFLNKEITLPNNCKVISNPPYNSIKEFKETYNITKNMQSSKELYSAIMEKILTGSNSSVIISPYSFLGGNKFYEFRKIMNNYNGFIVSFDNVPGNIFKGKKHGTFNSNLSNSVRASITVTENKPHKKGYKCSGLIRFKNTEREDVLKTNSLESLLSDYQLINETNTQYIKCFPQLNHLYKNWTSKSSLLKNYLISESDNSLCFPNACRYYSVASYQNLDRGGKIILNFKNEAEEKIIYCFLNSSFCYWHWRLYDGGILYQKSLLLELPVINFDLIPENYKRRLSEIAEDMRKNEGKYLSFKKNAGKMQENIKFPIEYIQEIDNIFLKVLGEKADYHIFDIVHSNHFLF